MKPLTKVHMSPFDYPQEKLNEMQKHMDALPITESNIRVYFYNRAEITIYFEHEEDAMVFKLKFDL